MHPASVYLVSALLAVFMASPAPLHAQPQYQIDSARSFSPGCDTLPVFTYFQVKGKYPESSQSLAARADAFLADHKTATDANGYITFRILIDCAGKIAAVKLLQTTSGYEACQFPAALVDNLYVFLRSLKEWNRGTRNGRTVNYSAYLSFKIESGHVVQVSP